MKKLVSIISIILFWTSIPLFSIVFFVSIFLGEPAVFGNGLFIYTRIAFFFLIVPLSSLIFGIVMTAKRFPCKKNIIAGSISFTLLVLTGMIGIMNFRSFDTSGAFIHEVEVETGLELPKHTKAMSSWESGGRLGNAKLLDKDEQKWFLEETKKDNWVTTIPLRVELLIPNTIKNDYTKFDYYSIYIKELATFNPTNLENGEYSIICIAYDKDSYHLQIFDSFKARLQIVSE